MASFVVSLLLVAATVWMARPVLASGGLRPDFNKVDGRVVLGLFAALSAMALVLGIDLAVGLLVAALVKAAGHLIGHRLVGDTTAEYRLVAFPGGPEAAGARAEDDLAAFFVLLMGPGLGLAPMVAAFTIAGLFAESAPGLAAPLRAYALAAGALNLVALLPLWPLAGGRLVQLIVEARFPQVTGLAAAMVAALFIGMSLTMQSLLLFLAGAVAGLALVLRPPQSTPRPCLSRAQSRIGFLAYFATLAAYFTAGWWVLTVLPSLG